MAPGKFSPDDFANLSEVGIDGAKALQALVAEHDALLIATPEYNGGYTALLKNAIDWVSRPREDGSPGVALARWQSCRAAFGVAGAAWRPALANGDAHRARQARHAGDSTSVCTELRA
ncbi:NADPH-dependent FMN reductase [Paraburkholderia guartelaensis]|uniref:NADPH-dependent FMN reductase n=1 Tax=Paraburkholderia guartelaensis TaxID=2546446 RepID=UPI002AB77137|nr:NADPH-dependent FMN reductase [Paraburkholderia guartelaensis]